VQMASTTQGTFDSSKCTADSLNGQCPQATADRSAGLTIFPGASEEALRKQAMLTAIVLMIMVFGTAIPGVRERLYPNVDWNAHKRKKPKNFVDIVANMISPKDDGYEARVEREFARLREAHERGELVDRTVSPAPPPPPPPPPAMEQLPERIMPRAAGFGRKGL
jgi:hypothetical protein